MRSRMTAISVRGTATSAIWEHTYRECVATFAPILMSFSRSVFTLQCIMGLGSDSRRKKLPRWDEGAAPQD